jgi:hypothetical protein
MIKGGDIMTDHDSKEYASLTFQNTVSDALKPKLVKMLGAAEAALRDALKEYNTAACRGDKDAMSKAAEKRRAAKTQVIKIKKIIEERKSNHSIRVEIR